MYYVLYIYIIIYVYTHACIPNSKTPLHIKHPPSLGRLQIQLSPTTKSKSMRFVHIYIYYKYTHTYIHIHICILLYNTNLYVGNASIPHSIRSASVPLLLSFRYAGQVNARGRGFDEGPLSQGPKPSLVTKSLGRTYSLQFRQAPSFMWVQVVGKLGQQVVWS